MTVTNRVVQNLIIMIVINKIFLLSLPFSRFLINKNFGNVFVSYYSNFATACFLNTVSIFKLCGWLVEPGYEVNFKPNSTLKPACKVRFTLTYISSRCGTFQQIPSCRGYIHLEHGT